MSAIKVSVVIPVYNVEKYLRECMNSVVNQTLNDIEIICVNDGSTDGSWAILREYAQKDERIKIINQENKGAGVARNTGLKYATGEYLAILDSDDIYDTRMLEKLYKKSKSEDLDINICRIQNLNNQTQQIEEITWSLHTDYTNKEIFNYKDCSRIFGFCVGWSWDKLYKREFVMKNNLKFQALRSTNDMLFVFLSLVLADRISYVDEVLVTHRVNSKTQLSETRDKDPFCFLQAVYELKQQLENRNLYCELEQSFLNWTVHFCFWHLDTLNEYNAKCLKQVLYNEVFNVLDIYSKPKSYFYDKNLYNRVHCKTHKGKLQILQTLFSVRNRDNHKVITVAGIKIKVRRRKNTTNKIYIFNDKGEFKEVTKVKGFNIDFTGNNNVIKIHETVKFFNCKITLGNNNTFQADKNTGCGIHNVNFRINSDNGTCLLGENLAWHGGSLLLCNEPNHKVSIGKNCLFSVNIFLRTSDGHSIYDKDTKELLNPDADITIGDNVWLGNGVTISKGVTIPNNVVIGTKSLITKSLDKEFCVYVDRGRIVRENIMWSSLSPEKYKQSLYRTLDASVAECSLMKEKVLVNE